MVVCVAVMGMFLPNTAKVSAYALNVKVEKAGPYAEKINDEMFAYAKKWARHFLKSEFDDKQPTDADFLFLNMDIDKKDTFILCKPYVYWDSTQRQDAVYIFPIAVDDKILASLYVMGRIEEPDYINVNFGPDENQLNELDYLRKNYVFFSYQGFIMAEDENGEITELRKDINAMTSSAEETEREETFYALDYNEKVKAVLEKMDNFMYHDEDGDAGMSNDSYDMKAGGGNTGQVPDADMAVEDLDNAVADNQTGNGNILPTAVVIGGAAVLVFVICGMLIRKKKKES